MEVVRENYSHIKVRLTFSFFSWTFTHVNVGGNGGHDVSDIQLDDLENSLKEHFLFLYFLPSPSLSLSVNIILLFQE